MRRVAQPGLTIANRATSVQILLSRKISTQQPKGVTVSESSRFHQVTKMLIMIW